MRLTNSEKLILTMLAEIHEKLEIRDGIDTKLLTSAIYSDNTWALSWEMPGIVADSLDPTPPIVNEVTNILGMWSFLEQAYANFDQPAKDKIKTEADPFGSHVKFNGFDGNDESEYLSIAQFLVKDMGRFSLFQGRDLNSHCTSIDSHSRMFQVFKPIRSTLDHHGLSPEQVIEILQAKRREA